MAFNDNSKNLKFTKSSIVNPKSFIRISKVWCQMRHFCGLFVLFFFNKVIFFMYFRRKFDGGDQLCCRGGHYRTEDNHHHR